jgi:hypothetical protein
VATSDAAGRPLLALAELPEGAVGVPDSGVRGRLVPHDPTTVVADEEVPREGARLHTEDRLVSGAGSVVGWRARVKSPGAGEGSSGAAVRCPRRRLVTSCPPAGRPLGASGGGHWIAQRDMTVRHRQLVPVPLPARHGHYRTVQIQVGTTRGRRPGCPGPAAERQQPSHLCRRPRIGSRTGVPSRVRVHRDHLRASLVRDSPAAGNCGLLASARGANADAIREAETY